MAKYAPIGEELKTAKETIDVKLGGWLEKERARKEEVKEKAEGLGLGDFVVVDDDSSVRGNLGSKASEGEKVEYEIVDAEKVPREYCEPSRGKIWAAVRSGVDDIPGVKITRVKRINVR